MNATPPPRRDPSRDALSAARRCGGYELLGSAGEEGATWLARRAGGDDLLVLRLARAEAEVVARARAAASVRHPGLVEVVGVDVVERGGARVALVAERAFAGTSLADVLRELERLSPDEMRPVGRDRLPGAGSFEARAAALGAQVAEALDALHAAGVAHGALGPESILFDEAGEVRLRPPALEPARAGLGPGIDARDRAGCAGAEPDAGADSASAGRPRAEAIAQLSAPWPSAPLAPERAGGGPPTPASDLFELGATLYALLALRPPFPGRGAELADSVLEVEPSRPTRVQPCLLPGADAVLLQALERSPARRPASAAALAADLRALSRGDAVSAPMPGWRRALGDLRARRGGIALALLFAFLGAAGGLRRHV